MISYRVSNAWKPVNKIFTKKDGTWKDVIQVYTKVSGTWKSLWTYKWTTGAWSECSPSCGSGTQTRTVVCTKQNGTSSSTVNDSLCTKFVSAKPSTSQTCTNGPCVEPDCRYSIIGGSPTYLYQTYDVPKDQSLSYTQFTWNGKQVGMCTPKCSEVYADGYKYTVGDYQDGDDWDINGYYYWGTVCRTPV